jgi:hypothetical protein
MVMTLDVLSKDRKKKKKEGRRVNTKHFLKVESLQNTAAPFRTIEKGLTAPSLPPTI